MNQLAAMCLSIAIEAPVALALRARWDADARGEREIARTLGIAAGATMLTHPMAWWLNTSGLRALTFGPRAAIIEGLVWAVETVVYARVLPMPWGRALLVSGLANGLSFGVGLALWYSGLMR